MLIVEIHGFRSHQTPGLLRSIQKGHGTTRSTWPLGLVLLIFLLSGTTLTEIIHANAQGIRYFTDMQMETSVVRSSGSVKLLNDCVAKIDDILRNHYPKNQVPSDTEVVVNITQAEQKIIRQYYLASEKYQSVFWVQKLPAVYTSPLPVTTTEGMKKGFIPDRRYISQLLASSYLNLT